MWLLVALERAIWFISLISNRLSRGETDSLTFPQCLQRQTKVYISISCWLKKVKNINMTLWPSWSKAQASGACSKERGFESHRCQSYPPDKVVNRMTELTTYLFDRVLIFFLDYLCFGSQWRQWVDIAVGGDKPGNKNCLLPSYTRLKVQYDLLLHR